MNAKQKRAVNQAKRALQHLIEMTETDAQFFNGTVAMLTGSAGTMIGAMSATHSASIEDVHTSTTRASRYMQEAAAKAYAEYLAAEANASGKQ